MLACFCRVAMLLDTLRGTRASQGYAAMALVEALAAVLVPPGASTTDPVLRHVLLSEAAALGRPLFALFGHPAGTIHCMTAP